ncbi:MAG TPA: ABC transporter permease [Steroidobacteraceae bacterium]|jgi:putative ABC transport system permease protein|nr:ABC transporter permease [Steroidobacteraceae bacterium]
MFDQWVHSQVALGLAQAIVVCALALAVAWLGHLRKLELGRETVVALVRGLLQMLVIGLVLVWLLKGAAWWSIPALAAMCATAAWMAQRKVQSVPHSYWLCLRAIGSGSTVVIVTMVLTHVIAYKSTALVPLGSMIVAASMNTCSQVLERFASDLKLNAGRVEAALALGASSSEAALPYAKNSTSAALIPSLNSLRSLGIVWIPGFAAGMLLAGSDPVYTAIYQFIVIAMLYAASGLTALLAASGHERVAFEEERLVAGR